MGRAHVPYTSITLPYRTSTLGVSCLSLSLVVAVGGCGLSLDYDPPDDAQSGDVGSVDAGAIDVGPRVDAPPPLDAPTPLDVAADAPLPPLDVPPDIGPVECVLSADCDAALGAPPCGAWECNAFACEVACAGCTTDVDRDGYGVGSGCAGLDCDDTDDQVGATQSRGCYAGPAGTDGTGVCLAGTEDCVAGTWGACLGQVLPGAESCNGLDDDCNGSADDALGTVACGLGACAATANLCAAGALVACAPGIPLTTIDGCNSLDDDCDGRVDESCTNCVWVGPAGNDASMDPRVIATPFRTVQRAIDFAAGDPLQPQRVCLLSAGCSNTIVVYAGAVTMAEGVTVQGSYGPGGAAICSTIRTEIVTGTPTGVLFPSAIAAGTTTLSDVSITPHPSSDTAGVTVDGAVGAVLRNVTVNTTTAGVTNGHGVVIRAGGDALITRSTIYAGRGSATANGVHVDGGRVTVLDNCPVALDSAGRCPMGCPWMTPSVGIRGRNDATPTRGAVSYPIFLRNAPGSLVSGSATCGHTSGRGAGVRIEGDATGTVLRGNFIAGWGGEMESYGIDMVDCAGASPWIVDNAEINGEGARTAATAAIRSMGACHPVIERNLRILSGLEGQDQTVAILCGPSPTGAGSSRCVIESNPSIRSTVFGFPMSSTGVRCEGDACARIVRNDISALQGQTILGLFLGTTNAFVSRNRISGGCATVSATGIATLDSRARVENNIILGGLPCTGGTAATAMRYVGLTAGGTSARSVLDLHSNTIDPGGVTTLGSCTSRGLELAGTAGSGLVSVRGNIALAGICALGYPVFEVSATADPLTLESNDLVAGRLAAVYRDEGTTDVATAALVNGFLDTTSSGNLDSAAGFVAYPTNLDLAAGSMCIDADVTAGAPAIDYDGHARIGVPDIGAFEN